MRRAILTAILMLVIGVGLGSYVFFKYAAVGTVRLLITNPPIYEDGSQAYDPSILHIVVHFESIDIHSSDAGSDSGWHPINVRSNDVDLVKLVSVRDDLGIVTLPDGRYNIIRIFAGTARVGIEGRSRDLIFNIPSGDQTGIKVPIVPGGFLLTMGGTVNVLLTISFNSHQILANATNIVPVVKAEVVPS